MRRWAGTVAVLLLASACSDGPAAGRPPAAASSSTPASPSPSGPALPTVREPADPVPGIEAEAVRLRTDAAAGGRIQVRITASDEFTVTSVALDSPGFEELPPREVSSDFVPGRVTDLRTPLGGVRCDVAPVPASARLTVVRGSAEPERVDVPLAAEVLTRIHADECAEQALARMVAIQVGGLRDDGDGLTGSLELLRRSGQEEVRVTRLARSVLMAVEADLPLVLSADAARASTAIRFTPATCEAHVLAETKQPFRFPMGVQVAADGERTADLPVSEDVRARLQALVRRVCG